MQAPQNGPRSVLPCAIPPCMYLRSASALAAASYTALPAAAQEQPGGSAPQSAAARRTPRPQQEKQNGITEQNGVYIYHINVVQRNLDAVNYLHRSGSTTIGFEGTSLLPAAKGEAKVTSERGGITIDANFKGLPPANGFGKEYLTYVLWAISADGRPVNLGEVLPSHDKDTIRVTTSFQSFGMIVTAEPYFSVSQPSDVVVLQNVIRPNKTTRRARTGERPLRSAAARHVCRRHRGRPHRRRPHHPQHDLAARALRGPQRLRLRRLRRCRKVRRPTSCRRPSRISRTPTTPTATSTATARWRSPWPVRPCSAPRTPASSPCASRPPSASATPTSPQQQAQQQAMQSQLAAEQAQTEKEKADAERARAEADAATARAHAAEATKSAQDANAVREQLRAQLNSVLATSETARGLIVHMSDVLFDTGKYTLKPDTKIALAKVSGILQAYPGLKLQVEGYTDSVGSDDYNQKLSENRSGSRSGTSSSPRASPSTTSPPPATASRIPSPTTPPPRAAPRTVACRWSSPAMPSASPSRPVPAAAPAAPAVPGSPLPTGQSTPPPEKQQ